MSSTKNPEHEAENPAPMPRNQQGQGGSSHQHDPAGQQGKKTKMAPRSDAPPGLEQDSYGNTIPLAQRTEEDRQKARRGR
jgi:hypothetical protein